MGFMPRGPPPSHHLLHFHNQHDSAVVPYALEAAHASARTQLQKLSGGGPSVMVSAFSMLLLSECVSEPQHETSCYGLCGAAWCEGLREGLCLP